MQAEAGPLAAAELAVEAVTPVAFLQEATSLLAQVRGCDYFCSVG